MSKHSINLFQPELLPEQATITLSRVVGLWCGVFVLMLAFSFYSGYQNEQSAKELSTLRVSEQFNKLRFAELEEQLKAKQKDPQLTARLELMKKLILNKKALHGQLTDGSRTYVQGFSNAMTELSNMHNNNISLQMVTITNDDLTFSGLAKHPEAVPAWLDGFSQSELLSGKTFVNFKLQENEHNMTEFVVSSITQSKAK